MMLIFINIFNRIQLLVRGYSQWDVAEELQIDQSTVSRYSI